MTKGLRILILEDRPADAELVIRELRKAGIQFVAKRVATEADFLAQLHDGPPDLILADYSLPAYDGLAALASARKECPQTPFMFVSGSLGEETAIEALHHGATDYVLKDRLARLGPAVQRALREIEERTQRQQADGRLRLLSEALESAANALVITDRGGLISWANPAFTQLTGYSLEEALGRKTSLLKSGVHDKAFYQDLWGTVLAGRVWSAEMTNRRKDGSLYTEQNTITPVRIEGGEVTHFIVVKEDVTERKHVELRIAAFSKLGQILSAAKTAREAAEIIVEVADQLLGWDACNFALYSPAQKLIHHVLNRDTVDGRRFESAPAYNHAPPTPLTNRAIVEGGQLILKEDPDRMEAGGVPFGGTSRPSASLLFVPVRNGTDVIGVLTIQSYTPRAYDQHSLDTLQTLADHCGGALDRITTEETLREAQQQLRQSQKMDAIGQLAGGVAHDFNNMLAVIRGNAELLLMKPDQHTDGTKAGLKQISAATERAANLTRQLLAFSRKQIMQSRPLVLNDVVADLTKMLRRIIGEHIDLQYHYGARLPFVQADAGMIEQVLLNLSVNARDAMPRGGQLLITTDTASFDSAYARSHPEASAGEFVCLTVTDTGTGIAPEHLPRIFEPFFTTKELGKGTGLGLATVYGIVKQHKGWIEVSSQLGAGATFRILLPAIPTPVKTVATPQVEASLPGGTETILLVEDDYGVRLITRRVLESHGYRIHEATTAREALEVWRSHAEEIALLLSDIVMPQGVSGRDLAEQLRASRPTLKVILMSGYSADVIGKDTAFFRRGRIEFLQKPFSSQALLQTVRRCLGENQPAPRDVPLAHNR